MRVIVEKSSKATMFLGLQEVRDCAYRKNRFVMWQEIDGNLLAFNNMINKMVLLSDEEVTALNNLQNPDLKVLEPLIRDWFLVPVDFREEQEIDRCYELSQLYHDTSFYNNFIILPTTDCNARCFYCFEHGVQKLQMTEQTALDVADFMVKKSKGKPITVQWFGGEPLYNKKAIDIICKELQKNEISFTSTMVSNGYLFDEETAKKAASLWNLKSVQITLDGTEDIYNKIKAFIYKDEESPFVRVTDNIETVMNAGIRVSIRLNVSAQNKDNILELIEWLDNRYINKDRLRIYCSNLFDLEHKRTPQQAAEDFNRFVEIDNLLLQKGLKNYSLNSWFGDVRGCMTQNPNSVVIAPNGKLGKCEHYSEGDKMFGSIYEAEMKQEALNYWKQFNRIEACKDCVAYPNCLGEGHCPDLSLQCALIEKPMKIRHMTMAMQNEWKQYLKKGNEETDDSSSC